MKIGPLSLSSPFALAPMAGMTDTAFRRLVKRKGAHARLVLSVDLIGQAVSVEVDAADARPY